MRYAVKIPFCSGGFFQARFPEAELDSTTWPEDSDPAVVGWVATADGLLPASPTPVYFATRAEAEDAASQWRGTKIVEFPDADQVAS